MVHVPYELVKHLIPPEERRKVKKRVPCAVCGNLVCSCAVDALEGMLRTIGLPIPTREYIFDPVRKWRFDFAWPAYRIAVEVDGGLYSGGRHTRGEGFEEDQRKTNAAANQLWIVIRVSTGMVKSGECLVPIEEAFDVRGMAS